MEKKKKYRQDQMLKENMPPAEMAALPRKSFLDRLFENSRLQYVMLFAFVLILYGNTLTLQYALDDRLLITENAFTKKGFAGIKDILTNDSFVGFFGEKKNLLTGGRYRPLSHIMFAVEYALFGLNPFIGHLLNLLLYALSCMLLLKVLNELFRNAKGYMRYMPFLVTLLFAAHPLHTEIVANIKGRDDILSFLFSLAAMYSISMYLNKRNILSLVYAAVLYFLALMSKENSITFIGLMPLFMYYFYNLKLKNYVLPLAFPALAAAIFIYLRFAVLGFELNIGIEKELLNNPFVNATATEKFATIFYTMAVYLKLLIIPHPLTHDYYPFHIPIVDWSNAVSSLALVLYVGMAIYTVWGIWRKQMPALGTAIYLITFSIASNIVFNIGTFMNERFMYVPLLGFCIALSYFILKGIAHYAPSKERLRVLIVYAFLPILMLYTLRTVTRNTAWMNDFTLFTTDVKTSVNSAKVTVSAGGVLIEESQKVEDPVQKEAYLNQALDYLKHGLDVHPHYVAAWVLYGNAFLYLEKFDESLVCYENALRIAPQNKDALNNLAHLAQLLNSRGFYDASISTFYKLNAYEPLNNDNKYMLARAYESKNKPDSALIVLFEILSTDSLFFNAHSKLGEIYGKVYNDIDKSLLHLHKAYEITPDDPSNLENLGIAYGIKRDFTRSLFFFEAALTENPEKPELYLNIAQTYAMMGRNDKAEEFKVKAQNVNPK